MLLPCAYRVLTVTFRFPFERPAQPLGAPSLSLAASGTPPPHSVTSIRQAEMLFKSSQKQQQISMLSGYTCKLDKRRMRGRWPDAGTHGNQTKPNPRLGVDHQQSDSSR